MARYSKHSMASAVALGMGLSACGGGGGSSGFSGVDSTPPPPPLGTVGAAAVATAPNAGLFPEASVGGPTLQNHEDVSFPLLGTVITFDSQTASADAAANSGGALLRTSASNGIVSNALFNVPGNALSDVALTVGGGGYWYYFDPTLYGHESGRDVRIEASEPYASNLSWTAYGTWTTSTAAPLTYSAFVTGFKTPDASVPTTGSATFDGFTVGRVFTPVSGGVINSILHGNATLQADFGTGNITGALTNMFADAAPWNNVGLTGTISSGINAFSGTAAVTSAPGGTFSLKSTATGNFTGMFFGPGAEELGAVWNLYDGSATAIGSIGAKKVP